MFEIPCLRQHKGSPLAGFFWILLLVMVVEISDKYNKGEGVSRMICEEVFT